jgi:hypothetical protein
LQGSRVYVAAVGFEGLLILPRFHDRAMIWSSALLQHFKTHKARIRATRLAVLPEQHGGLSRRRRHDFEIGHHVYGSIACIICAPCLLLTHRMSLLVCHSIWAVLASMG